MKFKMSENTRNKLIKLKNEGLLDKFFGDMIKNINKSSDERMTKILVKRDNMMPEEAVEFLNYNVYNSYIGEYTPIHIRIL